MKRYNVRIINNEPQQESLILLGDVVGTSWNDGERGIVVAVITETQFKVVTETGEFEDWINPYKFGANYELHTITDLISALLDI